MSNNTKAWALVREIPEHELRSALVDAHERIFDAAQDLEPGGGLDGAVSLEEAVDEALTRRSIVDTIADKLECSVDESDIESAVDDLLERLERSAGTEADGTPTAQALAETRERLEKALHRVAELEAEREQFCRRIAYLETESARVVFPEDIRLAVGDVLAMSRKLTSFCESAGIKPAHLRVTRTRKRAS